MGDTNTKCGFCKTPDEEEALVCPACGAMHYYYAYKGQGDGYHSAKEAEDQIKEVTEASPMKYAKYPVIFFVLSYVVYKTAGWFEPLWGVFAAIWIISSFILLPGSILILLAALWQK